MRAQVLLGSLLSIQALCLEWPQFSGYVRAFPSQLWASGSWAFPAQLIVWTVTSHLIVLLMTSLYFQQMPSGKGLLQWENELVIVLSWVPVYPHYKNWVGNQQREDGGTSFSCRSNALNRKVKIQRRSRNSGAHSSSRMPTKRLWVS